ncbi:TetR/AcrR family transcriptional regulator C-terminal domain-containing protein [Crossiella cryophila]|uniref:TetR/AcrR family tetracycline transcriptional repressor n=1 Tax=Crossiella cryophila TaxID=43355 RepID=A0A7W7CFQ5_9PSEU|nr:TetR/AcrR family transcriptional regulator C-terminal domain-containing protein [Crossiella cryophila]MBB4680381.1 TetR/AcrR family tetracycline transcriptional repressor [Crossiella cryophila]
MKINLESIARTALELLDESGLDGLTMRLVATRLNVHTSALYWHVKNKQQLLDVLANTIFATAAEGLEAPRAGVDWQQWLGDWARRLRQAMLAHQDGAKVFAGSNITEPAVFRATELALRTLQDAGFPVRQAARGVAALLHYTVGFTIEEQFHLGASPDGVPQGVDGARFPLTAQAYQDDNLFDTDTDDCFEYGLTVILAGMNVTRAS